VSQRRSPVPHEALATLRRKLALLPLRHPERALLMHATYRLYGISRASLYRLLRDGKRPRDAHRADRGRARVMPNAEIEQWCEIVAAMQARTTNRKGRCLSTVRAHELLIAHGIETPDGFHQLEAGRLSVSTLNRHMARLGYDRARMTREPAAVRYQAECANDIWHFDMSQSELKHLHTPPPWVDLKRDGAPLLMLFSVIDDRSGVAFVGYFCVYGEEVEAALRFLFAAMTAKPDSPNPLHGIPRTLHLDNGPVAKSAIFKRVMESLDVEVIIHMPAGSDGKRTTARAKGKVERPFRTIKDAHETLYHFHQPDTEAEANHWLVRYIDGYNERDHRNEPHSRAHDWLTHLPADDIREMCAWERYCAFAREPEQRKVGLDCRMTVAGVTYEVDPDLAGETVVVWWGLFDQELFVEHGDERYGPFDPLHGPVPLHRYRKHRKSRRDERSEHIDKLAAQLQLPRSALSGEEELRWNRETMDAAKPIKTQPFSGPDHFHELAFPNALAARKAIADELRLPLGRLDDSDRAYVAELVGRTLLRAEIMASIRDYFSNKRATARGTV
jgi:predicted DNA-binding transcriptional regulator AlpA